MPIVHPRCRNIPGGEGPRDVDHAQVLVNRNAAETVTLDAQIRGKRVGAHTGTPHHCRCGQPFPRRQCHSVCTDRGDTNAEPGLHPVLGQRGLDHWARRLAHVRADIPVVINEYDAGSDVRE